MIKIIKDLESDIQITVGSKNICLNFKGLDCMDTIFLDRQQTFNLMNSLKESLKVLHSNVGIVFEENTKQEARYQNINN